MKPSELPDVEYVAVDTETSALHPDDGGRVSVVSVAWLEGGAKALAWPFDQGIRDKLPQADLALDGDPNLPESEWEALMKWLAGRKLIMANAKFDLHMLRAGTRHWPGVDLVDNVVWDTMLATKELDPKDSLGLKDTAKRWSLKGGGEDEDAVDLKGFLRKQKLKSPIPGAAGYDLVPWAVMEPYAVTDAELTILLWAHQLDRLETGEGLRWRIEFELGVAKSLYRMESRGLRYDWEASMRASRVLDELAAKLEGELPFPATVPGAKRFFFTDSGVVPYKTTPTGLAQLDEEVLYRMIGDGVAWAKEYSEVSRIKRANSMWYEGYARMCGSDGRLRTTYKQTRVKSGRMSCERLQLQAIPKIDKALAEVPPVRNLILAKEGYELWNLDLSQAELRVAAHYAKCKAMLSMLEGGADLHGITTTQVFGIEKGEADWKVKRDIAKRLTFGGIFQIGGRTFQKTLSKLAHIDWPVGQCEEMVRVWRGLYPEFGRAYHSWDRHASREGWVPVMPGGRWERRSWFKSDEYTNTAWNRVVQGSLALFNSIWLVELERLWPGVLVLNVHDSMLLELPKREAAEIAAAVAAHTGRLATELFGVQMLADVTEWQYYDRVQRENDSYAWA